MNLALHVRSSSFELSDSLVSYLSEPNLAVIRNHEGLIGIGETLRLVASGPNRIKQLAEQWQKLVEASQIEDQVQLPGTGLTAFGSIAFSENSALESVLVVPELLIGVRDGRGWMTRFTETTATPTPQAIRHEVGVEFHDGQLDSSQFTAAVTKAIQKISAGQLEKVVLARDIQAALADDFDLRPVLARLAENYPSCWTYSVDGTFGASPELLVRVSHGQVATRVLAGTTARGETEAADLEISTELKNSHKNLAEHALALDSVTAALKPLTTGVDFDEIPFAVKLPNLWHLASDVHAVIAPGVTGLDLVAALHPTAAVAGTPRDAALELISELEPFDRGRYAGPVGWISSSGDCEWAIALRGGQIAGNKVIAYAGCGLVAESNPDHELAETNLKFRPIREALG